MSFFKTLSRLFITVLAGAIGARPGTFGAASHHGSGSIKKIRLWLHYVDRIKISLNLELQENY
jgi:hypothetical protein